MPDLNNCVVYDVEVVTGPDGTPGGWDNPLWYGILEWCNIRLRHRPV